MDHDLDESEALRKAARAGILLLEKNQELQDENEALRAQLVILESERPTLRAALRSRDEVVAGLQDERKQCLVEINALRSELKAKSAMVTSLLDREQQLKSEVEEVAAAKRLAEFHVESLQFELAELQLGEGEKRRSGAEGGVITMGSNNSADAAVHHSVTNPAASYDSNQTSVFTWADYEELAHKWQAAATESDALQLELRSVRKEVEGLRKKAAKATEYYIQVEKLEKRNGKLQSANDTLNEELIEERALLESLRTMNLMYKVRLSLNLSLSLSPTRCSGASLRRLETLGILTIVPWSLCLCLCSKSQTHGRSRSWMQMRRRQQQHHQPLRTWRHTSSAFRSRTCSWTRT